MSYVHEVQTVYDVVQSPQMILLCEKGARGDNARCECCCLKGARAVHSKIIWGPTPPLLQAKQTLLALPTWPAPAKRPVAIGKP